MTARPGTFGSGPAIALTPSHDLTAPAPGGSAARPAAMRWAWAASTSTASRLRRLRPSPRRGTRTSAVWSVGSGPRPRLLRRRARGNL